MIVRAAFDGTQVRVWYGALGPSPAWVITRLEQVIVNLLTNAAKYTHDRGRISLIVQQEEGEAVLRVKDTGVGIAPELLPHIFELSHRRNDHWTARKVGWESASAWCNEWRKCTGGE